MAKPLAYSVAATSRPRSSASVGYARPGPPCHGSSCPINASATVPRSVSAGRAWSTARAVSVPTGVRMRSGRHGRAGGVGQEANPPVRPSAGALRPALSPHPFAPAGLCGLRLPSAKRCGNA
jgi:hypothetical protein